MDLRSFSDYTGVPAGAHIPVADDNADLRSLMRASLEMAGAMASIARDRVEDMALRDQHGIDLLVCDARMLGMDGRERRGLSARAAGGLRYAVILRRAGKLSPAGRAAS